MPLFRDERCHGAAGGTAPDNDDIVGVVCVHLPLCFYMRSKHFFGFVRESEYHFNLLLFRHLIP